MNYYEVPRLPKGCRVDTLPPMVWYELKKRWQTCGPRALFASWDLCVQRFGAEVYALTTGSTGVEILSVNATYFGKRNGYMNNYIVFTPEPYRGKGYATTLELYVENLARQRGCTRGKALTMSFNGFKFHRALGHHFWGRNKRGEFVIDFPLSKHTPLPAGSHFLPQNCQPQPLKLLNIAALVTGLLTPPFNLSEAEVEHYFMQHPLEYR